MGINGVGGADGVRRTKRSEPERPEKAAQGEIIHLPVPVERVRRIDPRAQRRPAEAAFAAHLIGQDGEKRGLRAGPELMIRAERAYNRAEYSGANDRRAPLGARVQARV